MGIENAIEITRGGSKDFHVRITQKSDGNPFDLTGLTGSNVSFKIEKADGTFLELTLSSGLTLANAAGGVVQVSISTANSALLKVENCQDFQLTIVKSGKTYKKLVKGMVNVLADITEE